MPTVNIGLTSKRINSTSQIFSGGASLSCKLKEPCSMHSPVFIVQGLSKSTFYNYCSFEGRYYWVDDIVYLTNNIQEVHCRLDPLATYKDAIKDSYAWVKYADAGHWNKKIDDIRMQPEIQATSSTPTIKSLFDLPFDPVDGSVLMRVMEAGPAGNQGVATYAMSYATFEACLVDLRGFMDGLTQGMGNTIADLGQVLGTIWASIGGQGSWRDNILSCVYMPLPISVYSDLAPNAGGMFLGAIPTTGTMYRFSSPFYIKKHSGSLTIPWASDAQTYEFLKNPRWTAFQIQAPGGFQDVDPTDLKDQQSCGFFSAINLMSGDWSCKITEGYIDSGEIIAAFSGNVAQDILGQVGSAASYSQAFGNGVSTVVRAALGDVTVATQIGEAKSSGTVLSESPAGNTTLKEFNNTTPVYHTEGSGISGAFVPSGISVGSASGNIGGGGTNMFLNSGSGGTSPGSLVFKNIQYKPADLNNYTAYCDRYGYPCNAYLQIGSVSGYIQCVGATVSAATGATEGDKSTINSYLNSGIYIE